jgi:hypothetical protein
MQQTQSNDAARMVAHYQAKLQDQEEQLRYVEAHNGPLIMQRAANGEYIDGTPVYKDSLRRAIEDYRQIIADWSAKK